MSGRTFKQFLICVNDRGLEIEKEKGLRKEVRFPFFKTVIIWMLHQVHTGLVRRVLRIKLKK